MIKYITEITHENNAWHKPTKPEYIEWWYLDAQFDTQELLSGSFCFWGNIERPKSFVIRSDFFLKLADGSIEKFYKSVSLDDFHASTDICNINISGNKLMIIEDNFELNLFNNENSYLVLNISPTHKGFGFEYIVSKKEEKKFSWIVPVPRGEVHGFLQRNGTRLTLDGVGYHDHNWASFNLSKEFKAWSWGRLFCEGLSIIFFTISFSRYTFLGGVVIYLTDRENEDIHYHNFEVNQDDFALKENFSGWTLSISHNEFQLFMEIKLSNKLLERVDSGYYQRHFSEASGNLYLFNDHHRFNGMMIHEFKLLG
jgi:predicted secreted hydrolase